MLLIQRIITFGLVVISKKAITFSIIDGDDFFSLLFNLLSISESYVHNSTVDYVQIN